MYLLLIFIASKQQGVKDISVLCAQLLFNSCTEAFGLFPICHCAVPNGSCSHHTYMFPKLLSWAIVLLKALHCFSWQEHWCMTVWVGRAGTCCVPLHSEVHTRNTLWGTWVLELKMSIVMYGILLKARSVEVFSSHYLSVQQRPNQQLGMQVVQVVPCMFRLYSAPMFLPGSWESHLYINSPALHPCV